MDHVQLCCAHLQLHVSQRDADGVNGAAEIRAGGSLCQVVHQKLSFPPLDFDIIPLRLCLHQNLLLKDKTSGLQAFRPTRGRALPSLLGWHYHTTPELKRSLRFESFPLWVPKARCQFILGNKKTKCVDNCSPERRSSLWAVHAPSLFRWPCTRSMWWAAV